VKSPSSRWLALFGAGLLSITVAPARDKWIAARSPHFEMFSSASESDSRDLLNKLEQFRATVLAIYPLPRFYDPKTTIVLFATDRQFKPYKPLFDGRAANVAGYCTGGFDETMITMTADNDSEQTDEIIFHEYVHLLIGSTGDTMPLWLNEGLAELFSTFKIVGDSYEMCREKPEHTNLLRNSHLMPLGELFAVTRQSSDYNEGTRQGIYYAESWAFVHFMVCGKESESADYLSRLSRFNELIASPNAPIHRSFREAFGMDYDEMERELGRYLNGGSYRYKRGRLVLGDLASQIKFRPAGDFERDVALINLRWRVRDSGDAAYQLLQLAQSHPESPLPHEVLAAVAWKSDDTEVALGHWQRAAELGSDNPFVYVRLAADRLNRLSMGLSLDYRMPEELAGTLRGWLDRAITLSPRWLEAYEKLAMVEAFAEQPRVDAANRAQEAAPKMRDKTRTLFAIAVIHWRVGDDAGARQIAEFLIAAPETSPQLRSLAKQLKKRLALKNPPAAPVAAAPAGKAS
jgi:hypothetical protein